MLILGVDSTAVTASVAIAEVKAGELISHSVFTVKNKMTHSENLMPMVDHVLQVYGKEVSDLELLAVNAGPGSFTGVRIGVATVKGLAFPKGLPCAPVSTLDSLAQNLKDIPGTVCALMDARRNQFYYAIYENGNRLTPNSCGSLEEISAQLAGKNAMLCGDGAAVFASLFEGECPHTVANPVIREQNALSVALCGYRMYTEGNAVSGKELRPIYLRVPQAERERLERLKGE